MSEERIIDLERHMALQERTIADLGDVIAQQWKVIDALKRDVEMLKDRLRGVEGAIEEIGPQDAPPPHY